MATATGMPALARAIQRTTRQSPYKMRLVIDQIRGKNVNEALALLKFSKKHAAKEIEKVLNSAVANAEYKAREANAAIDVDRLYVSHAIVNEGPKLKRFTPAAMGRATPIQKRTSHVEIEVMEREARARAAAGSAGAGAAAKKAPRAGAAKTGAAKTGAAKKGASKKTAAKKTATEGR
jgi:large subunit ribosomal protein L22